MDESLSLSGRSRAAPIGVVIYYWTGLPWIPVAGVKAVEFADELTIHGIGGPEVTERGSFVARSLLVTTDRTLFRPLPMRWAYLTSCGPL
jgi:hypothetical protein